MGGIGARSAPFRSYTDSLMIHGGLAEIQYGEIPEDRLGALNQVAGSGGQSRLTSFYVFDIMTS